MTAVLLTKKELKPGREEFVEIIKSVRNLLNKKYKFIIKANGSSKYNFVIKDNNGEYDFDYLMLITKNSKSENYVKNKTTEIRNEIFEAFQQAVENLSYNTEQSTKVITLIKVINDKREWSYDICITKELPNKTEEDINALYRNSNGSDGGNNYTWNILGCLNEGEKWFNNLEYIEKEDMRKIIIDRKLESKNIGDKNHKNYKTTFTIFLEVYNENK